jgi:hypothetical protein
MNTSARFPRIVSGSAILAVAVVAGVISYQHIEDLSLALHQPVMVARLMPFGVDGLITVGSVVPLQGGRLGWLRIGPGVAISLFANVESGIRYGWLAAVWAGIPAVSFALASFILEHWLKGQAAGTPVSAPQAAPESIATMTPESTPESTRSAPEGAPVRAVKSTAKAGNSRSRQPKPGAPETVYADALAKGELPSIRAIRRDMRVGDVKAKAIRGQLEEALKDLTPVAA